MSRAAVNANCRSCGERIMVGLDASRAGIVVHADPHPLTRTGELLAVCAGYRVYSLDLKDWLDYRDAARLKRPAIRVLAEHRCGENVPQAWRQPLPKKPTHNTQEVPF